MNFVFYLLGSIPEIFLAPEQIDPVLAIMAAVRVTSGVATAIVKMIQLHKYSREHQPKGRPAFPIQRNSWSSIH